MRLPYPVPAWVWPLVAVGVGVLGMVIFAIADWVWMKWQMRKFDKRLRRYARQHADRFKGR